jgi:hypothetical protein
MKVLGFLPGYYWTGSTLKSTGSALPPTQHMDPETGEVIYYVKPYFDGGPTVGLYIKRSGLMRAIAEGRA